MSTEILSNQQMAQADRLAIQAGTEGVVLMENAGAAVAGAIFARYEPCKVCVLCGPGNNGGDGFVVARLLSQAGWPVRVATLVDPSALSGDAEVMFHRWITIGTTEVLPLDALSDAELVVDALFGTGLNRPISGEAAQVIESVSVSSLPVVAVDVPSGLSGFGQQTGPVFEADQSVTFFRKKPAHVLMPGRRWCGEVVVADIGIEHQVLSEIQPQWRENQPDWWGRVLPRPQSEGHKYHRGHSLVVSGGLEHGGAARLAARGALRVGSGLVTVAGPPESVVAHASRLDAIMVRGFEDLDVVLEDERLNAVLLGPGNGVGEATRNNVRVALGLRRSCVLDADALTSFAGCSEELFALLNEGCVLTPHDGELARLFPERGQAESHSRLERALVAANESGAVVVLKGPDTVVAAPDGRASINASASPFLATAGSGDVLAGMICGLRAQGMPAFEAASAAVWMHGRAGSLFGPGLIAEDLPELLPRVLRGLFQALSWPT